MSEFLKINGKDLLRGAIVAGLAIITASLAAIFDAGGLPTTQELLNIGKIAGTAALSYLLKNLFTNSSNVPFKAE